ncbi:DUF4913 domain-containing protein [Isoptericola sp. NPDC055881]
MSEQYATDDFMADLDPGDGEAVQTYYPNVAEWVENWLLPHYKRDLSKRAWDPRWWEYTEAISVLEAMWQAWEFHRTDSVTSMAVYFRDFHWPMMRELTSKDGPFWRLDNNLEARNLPPQWEAATPPVGLFRDVDHPAEAGVTFNQPAALTVVAGDDSEDQDDAEEAAR